MAELTREQEVERRYRVLGEIIQRAQEAAATDPDWLRRDWDAELYDEETGLPR